jgi:hypothetical protein
MNMRTMDLWNRTPDQYTNGLLPFFLDELGKNRVTFIGLNPSFSEPWYKSKLQGTEYESIDIREFYTFPESSIFDMERSLSIERHMRTFYPYFNTFKELMLKLGDEWNHIDLFYFRETSQKDCKKYIFIRDPLLNHFAEEQLDITKRLLERIEPKVIVVANALASRIYKNAYTLEFDDEYGCYFTEIAGKRVPTFLTSMLSGQRALDIFSRERLSWHIRKVLDEIR